LVVDVAFIVAENAAPEIKGFGFDLVKVKHPELKGIVRDLGIAGGATFFKPEALKIDFPGKPSAGRRRWGSGSGSWGRFEWQCGRI
jgi:hypothetical protein